MLSADRHSLEQEMDDVANADEEVIDKAQRDAQKRKGEFQRIKGCVMKDTTAQRTSSNRFTPRRRTPRTTTSRTTPTSRRARARRSSATTSAQSSSHAERTGTKGSSGSSARRTRTEGAEHHRQAQAIAGAQGLPGQGREA